MKLCILWWAVLFCRIQVAVSTKEVRIRRHRAGASSRTKGERLIKNNDANTHPWITSLPTPKTASLDMDEGKHRTLRRRKRGGKRHHSIADIFDVFHGNNRDQPTRPIAGCWWPPLDCDDGDLCTHDDFACRNDLQQWECVHSPTLCGPGERCDHLDGVCKHPNRDQCPPPAPACDDGNPCTSDSVSCSKVTRSLKCVYTPNQCGPNASCDLKDGTCKLDDEIVPCVAVIDEDESFGDQKQTWAEFRSLYPERPFCLLVPTPDPSYIRNVSIPNNFKSDKNVVYEFGIPRDNGDVSLASDWVSKCRLDRYTSANVGWVGLFVDTSGSMDESEIIASRDVFIKKLKAMNIQVHEVTNKEENWIEPFMTTLAPTTDET